MTMLRSSSTLIYFAQTPVSIPDLVAISLSFDEPPAMALIIELYVAGSRSSCFSRFSNYMLQAPEAPVSADFQALQIDMPSCQTGFQEVHCQCSF